MTARGLPGRNRHENSWSFHCRLALALGFGGAASAASLATVNPADPNFTLTGPFAVSHGFMGYSCGVIFQGTVSSSGTATINSFSATGGTSCTALIVIYMPNMPWSLSAPSTTSLKLTGIQFTSPIVSAVCGPGDLNMVWSSPTATANMVSLPGAPAPDCRISAALTASNLKVVP